MQRKGGGWKIGGGVGGGGGAAGGEGRVWGGGKGVGWGGVGWGGVGWEKLRHLDGPAPVHKDIQQLLHLLWNLC